MFPFPAPAPVDAVQLDIKQEKTPESKFLLPSNTVLVPDPPAEQVLPVDRGGHWHVKLYRASPVRRAGRTPR